MISVCFQGGLANRMFQYAFYRSLVAKGYDAYVDNYNFKPRKRMTFEAVDIEDPFPNIDIQYTPKGKFKFSCVCGRKGKILRYINSLIKKEQYVFEPKFKYCPEIFADLGDNCEIVGLWQTEKYFKDISEDANEEEEQRPIKKVGLFLLAACAGEGNDVDGEIQPEEEIVSPYPEAEFAIRISGDSMEPTIHDQETVFVVKAEELNDGDIGIFVVNGVTMCKRYIDDGTSVWLKPDNKEHNKIQITDAIEDYRLQFKVLGYS